jgi:ATP-dependent DNA ligase
VAMRMDNYIHIAPVLFEGPENSFRRIVNGGGEGIIIKKTDAIYHPGKKPAGVWIKGKKKITLDVIITGYNDGTGKNKQLFGSIEFSMIVDGKIKKMGQASSGLNDETRALIASNPEKYLNTVMEIESIQESKNSFRNAVFLRLRDDKGADECTMSTIRIKDELL